MNLLPSPKKVAWVLVGAILVLATLSVTGHGLQYVYGTDRYVEFVRLFNISGEGNVAAWFSSALLLLCGVLAFAIATFQGWFGKRRYLRHWQALSLVFLYISLDETAQIHEAAFRRLPELFGAEDLLDFAWVLFALLLFLAFALAYARFVLDLPAEIRRYVILAAALYLTGALGLELVSAYVIRFWPDEIIVRGALATGEDLFEMLGVVSLLYAWMAYLKDSLGVNP